MRFTADSQWFLTRNRPPFERCISTLFLTVNENNSVKFRFFPQILAISMVAESKQSNETKIGKEYSTLAIYIEYSDKLRLCARSHPKMSGCPLVTEPALVLMSLYSFLHLT